MRACQNAQLALRVGQVGTQPTPILPCLVGTRLQRALTAALWLLAEPSTLRASLSLGLLAVQITDESLGPLALCKVEVLGFGGPAMPHNTGLQLLSLNKPTAQSSSAPDFPSARAVDGIIAGTCAVAGCTSSWGTEVYPWW